MFDGCLIFKFKEGCSGDLLFINVSGDSGEFYIIFVVMSKCFDNGISV